MTSEEKLKLVEMFKQGYTDKQIAETIHYSKHTVKKVRGSLRLLRRRADLTPQERHEIGRLYCLGLPVRELKERFGCCYSSIRKCADLYRRENKK